MVADLVPQLGLVGADLIGTAVVPAPYNISGE